MVQMFNDHARRVVVLSQEVAVEHESSHIGPAHLLVGVLGAEGSVAATALRSSGLGPEMIPASVLKIEGRRRWRLRANVPFDPESRAAIDQALPEARRFGHGFIGAEHLLLGLLHDERGTCAALLRDLGVSPAAVRGHLHRIMTGSPTPGS